MKKNAVLYIVLLIAGIASLTAMNLVIRFSRTAIMTLTFGIIVPILVFLLSLFLAFLARKNGWISHFAWILAGVSLADFLIYDCLLQFVMWS